MKPRHLVFTGLGCIVGSIVLAIVNTSATTQQKLTVCGVGVTVIAAAITYGVHRRNVNKRHR